MAVARSSPNARPEERCGAGSITLLCGCMFSGKTTALLRRVEAADGQAIVFKHLIDTRYSSDAVVTHGGKARTAVVVDGSESLMQAVEDETTLVAIDEAHFLDDGILDVVCGLRDRGVEVIMTALDRDSWGNPFALVAKLSALCDNRQTLTATCAVCGGVGNRTQRTRPIVDGNMVGGSESYEPRCEGCWKPPATSAE